MKISYILQLKDFFILCGIGFLLGVFYGILNLVTSFKKRLTLQIIIDLIFSMTFFLSLIISINAVNMGQFRLFLLIGYICGFFIERITLGKLFAKGFKKVYNLLTIICKRFSQSKVGRIIFK
jgi:hypothetical protein